MPNLTRYFQFSLRTMLIVVTLICLWLGWEVYRVRQRTETLAWLKQRTNLIEVQDYASDTQLCLWGCVVQYADEELPWHRRLLGDRYLKCIGQLGGSPEIAPRIQAVFPEATIRE